MEDIDKAKKVVENFIYEMNLWEKSSEEIDNDEKNGLSWQQKDAIIKEKVTYIITKYCTTKKRAMSSPNSIMRGIKGTYNYDSNEEKIFDVKVEKTNRILIYTYKEEERQYYCYVLLKKDSEWLIDSKKRRFYKDEKWVNSYL
jgi:hypothetical protein